VPPKKTARDPNLPVGHTKTPRLYPAACPGGCAWGEKVDSDCSDARHPSSMAARDGDGAQTPARRRRSANGPRPPAIAAASARRRRRRGAHANGRRSVVNRESYNQHWGPNQVFSISRLLEGKPAAPEASYQDPPLAACPLSGRGGGPETTSSVRGRGCQRRPAKPASKPRPDPHILGAAPAPDQPAGASSTGPWSAAAAGTNACGSEVNGTWGFRQRGAAHAGRTRRGASNKDEGDGAAARGAESTA